MISAVWNRLWEMHDETKALALFRPKSLLQRFNKQQNLQFSNGRQERDVDLADEFEEAPAEHTRRISSGPGGVEEGEPREYTGRQLAGLWLGPILFILMLIVPTPAGMEPAAQKMAAVALLMATWWMCESIPIPATSLLPFPCFPCSASPARRRRPRPTPTT
jgi:solute carrier family 13 (sodium-dependent dicarboxylate transporter), member 2/3/5